MAEKIFPTTHAGSLPRPLDLVRMMFAKEEGVPVEAAALDRRIAEAVREIVKKQVAAGVDIVNDGREAVRRVESQDYALILMDWTRVGRQALFLLVFVVAAILTPPDVISQLSLAIPAYFLYEASILAVVMVERKRAPSDETAGSDVTPSSS